MQTPGLEAGPADPGKRHLPELVRTRLDSWYPSHLAPRFQPSQRPRPSPFLRPLPLVLAALLLVLLAATALAGSPRALTDVIVNLAGSHPGATPTPHPHSAVAVGPAQIQPAPAAIVTNPSLVTPSPADSGLLAVRNPGLASAARTSAPVSPEPLPGVSPAVSMPREPGGTLAGNSPTPSPSGSPQPSQTLPPIP